MDVISTIPFETVASWITAESSNIAELSVFRTLRVLRLGRLFKLFQISNASEALDSWKLDPMLTNLMVLPGVVCVDFTSRLWSITRQPI